MAKKKPPSQRPDEAPAPPPENAIYTLKVYLIGGPVEDEYADQEISRTIQIRGRQTLADLHEAIYQAFDREEEHLYEFQFGKGPHDPSGLRFTLDPGSLTSLTGRKPPGDVLTTTLDALGLVVGQSFGYWFDFGDDWMHQIDVEAIGEAPAEERFPKLVNAVGPSPPQYPDYDEDEDETDDEDDEM
jgi:hypothetical protein